MRSRIVLGLVAVVVGLALVGAWRASGPVRLTPPVRDVHVGSSPPPPRVASPERRIPATPPVPVETMDAVDAAVQRLGATPWDGLHPDEWLNEADALAEQVDALPPATSREERGRRIAAYLQIARAAENANQGQSDYYRRIAGQQVNWYAYRAAGLSVNDPGLADEAVTGLPISGIDAMRSYEGMIRAGELPLP